MTSRILIFISIVLSISYGLYSIDTMILSNKTPYSVKCLGLKLDGSKSYHFAKNDTAISDNQLVISYPHAEALLPDNLAKLEYNNTLSQWQLSLDSNYSITSDISVDIHKPICVKSTSFIFYDDLHFYPSNTIINEKDLNHGIKINSKLGDSKTRIPISILEYNGAKYLSTKYEGLGVEYYLRDSIHIDLCFKSETSNDNLFAFIFNNLSQNDSGKRLDLKFINTTFHSKVSYSDSSFGSKIYEGSVYQFDVNGFLFEVKPKFTRFDFGCLCIAIAFLILMQFYLFRMSSKTNNPLIRSIFYLRIGFNSLCFLALPLFITAFNIHSNRIFWMIVLIILNLLSFIPKSIFLSFSFTKNKYFSISILIICIIIIVCIFFFKKNEAVFNIPILHISKAILVCVLYTLSSLIPNLKVVFKFGLIFCFAVIIGLVSSDLGSAFYVGLALFLLYFIDTNKSYKHGIFWLICIVFSVWICISCSENKSRKLFRIEAPYGDISKMDDYNQGDRETYSGLSLILKNFWEGSTPLFNDLVVPEENRSVFHTDYSVLFSIIYGRWAFIFIFGLTVYILVSQIILLLYASSKLMKVRDAEYFNLPNDPKSDVVKLLIALTLIQIIYPIFSNTLIAPITGQSTPILGISQVEVMFIILLLTLLDKIFYNPEYYINQKITNTRYIDVTQNVSRYNSKWIIIFGISLLLSNFISNSRPSEYDWKKHTTDRALLKNIIIPADSAKRDLVTYANKLSHDPKSIDYTKTTILKDIISRYYNDQPFRTFFTESSRFHIFQDLFKNKTSFDSLYNIDREKISGTIAPFGEVYRIRQKQNSTWTFKSTNKFYNTISANHKSVNADLTAELNQALNNHIPELFASKNSGAIMIVNNHTGRILSNASSDLSSVNNYNQKYYFVGSIKKYILAYAALKINPNYKYSVYGNGETFDKFLIHSKDTFAGFLLKDILTFHKSEFAKILKEDFDLDLYSRIDDAYLDSLESKLDFRSPMNNKNILYRIAIGQQKPYKLETLMQIYARIASQTKVKLTYSLDKDTIFEPLSLSPNLILDLKNLGNKILTQGTAEKQGDALQNYNISLSGLWAKTGTAELSDKLQYLNKIYYPNTKYSVNSSASFIISNEEYTIGISLQGLVPDNHDHKAAKHLFEKLIPILIKYQILK